jgi:hypothetical protein
LLLQFFVTVPPDRTAPVLIKVKLAQSSLPRAQIAFRIPVENARAATSARLLGEKAKVFTRAFLSYSTADRVSVLRIAQLLDALSYEYFLDMLSLKAGERRWEQRIFDEIEQADLFLLFWSNAASKSKWVVAEAEYALRFSNRTDQKRPDFKPLILGTVPYIPPSLSSINLNDKFRYLISGAEAEAAERAAKSPESP